MVDQTLTGKDTSEIDLPDVLPVFPLDGVILLPRNSLPLNVFEPRYLTMVRDAYKGNKLIGMIQPRDKESPDSAPDLYHIGCVGSIEDYDETTDGRILITLRGICRFKITREMTCTTPYRQIQPDWQPFLHDDDFPDDRLGLKRDHLFKSLTRFLELNGMEADFTPIKDAPPEVLINTLSMVLPFMAAEKQALLEAENLEVRIPMLISLIDMANANLDAASINDIN